MLNPRLFISAYSTNSGRYSEHDRSCPDCRALHGDRDTCALCLRGRGRRSHRIRRCPGNQGHRSAVGYAKAHPVLNHDGSCRSLHARLLRKVDPTFRLRRDQLCTAVNDKGFEMDVIRREMTEGDPHPLRITDAEDDFWVTQAERAAELLNAPHFSAMIVSPSGTWPE